MCDVFIDRSRYRSLDPAIRVQQDLTPAADSPTWKALLPVVDAWVWWQPKLTSLPMIAEARKAGKSAYMCESQSVKTLVKNL